MFNECIVEVFVYLLNAVGRKKIQTSGRNVFVTRSANTHVYVCECARMSTDKKRRESGKHGAAGKLFLQLHAKF